MRIAAWLPETSRRRTSLDLQVRNDNYLDIDVFALTEGVRTRLGMVTGSSTRNFLLPGTVTTEGVSILATPIGGSGRRVERIAHRRAWTDGGIPNRDVAHEQLGVHPITAT